MASKLIPVVISGGSGTRLWPLSTDERPKQFHALSSVRTLIQETVTRTTQVEGLEALPPMLVCNERHLGLAQEQMAAIGHAPGEIILEPFGRNTAPVAMAAALAAQALDPDALVLLMPSDHAMTDPKAFAAAAAQAAPMARERIVLFGVKPTAPETGYGYIEAGDSLADDIFTVARFVEKPDLPTAEGYLASGRYLWNAGLFLFSPAVLIEEMERWAPEVARATRAAFEQGQREPGRIRLDADAFRLCPSISVDYAVMEHSDRSAVMPLDCGWADIGTWSALWSQGPRDERGNLVHGEAALIDSANCLVWSEGKAIGVIGVEDLIVVQTEEAVVVLPRSRAQDVRLLVEQFKARRG